MPIKKATIKKDTKKAVKKPVKTVKKTVEKEEKEEVEKKRDYLYAVGKRKTSIAQVRVYKKGKGAVKVNGKEMNVYFPTDTLREIVIKPLKLIGQQDKLDVSVKVIGGGSKSQSEATRHGISKALIQLNPNFRKPLKKAGYLTRDARKKERKKPGLRGARRAPQWSKR
ncbi:MAG TPA: 30S ribosomal protein S9 [Candidatus Bipolaricaulota bacterium]|nr:30S ribosomal protein S9 [Candidatus Bipolaricaulota bacterium]